MYYDYRSLHFSTLTVFPEIRMSRYTDGMNTGAPTVPQMSDRDERESLEETVYSHRLD